MLLSILGEEHSCFHVSELFSLQSHQSWCVRPTGTTSWKSSAQFQSWDHKAVASGSTWSWGVPVTQDQRYTPGPVADRSLKNKPLFWDLLGGFLSDLCTNFSWKCLHQHHQSGSFASTSTDSCSISRTADSSPLTYFYTSACDFTLDHGVHSPSPRVKLQVRCFYMCQFPCWQSPRGCNSTSRVQILLNCITVLFKVCSL